MTADRTPTPGLHVAMAVGCVVALSLMSDGGARADEADGGAQPQETRAESVAAADADQLHSPMNRSELLWLLAAYSVPIVSASLVGGWIPGRLALSHVQFQTIISFLGGLMLGIGVFHLFPHSVQELGERRIDSVSAWMMAGMVLMFLLLRVFHFHHHGTDEGVDPAATHSADHTHSHDHHDAQCSHGALTGRYSWLGIFTGLALHTLLDGVALGAAMQAESGHATGAGLFGIGILAAVVLHKPLDALSITTLMKGSGWSSRSRTTVNVLFATLCPLGAVVFLYTAHGLSEGVHELAGVALAFSAGVFMCISLSDLLPEMQFHSHHQLRLTLALFVGIALAWGLRFVEPTHFHP